MQRPDELVAMHFAMELLRVLEGLAAARLVHTDIKPDNLLVVVGDGGAGGAGNMDSQLLCSFFVEPTGGQLLWGLLPPGAMPDVGFKCVAHGWCALPSSVVCSEIHIASQLRSLFSTSLWCAGADENAAPVVTLQLIDFGRSVDLELLPAGTLLQVWGQEMGLFPFVSEVMHARLPLVVALHLPAMFVLHCMPQ